MNPRSILSNFWGSLHFDTPSRFFINANNLEKEKRQMFWQTESFLYLCRIF